MRHSIIIKFDDINEEELDDIDQQLREMCDDAFESMEYIDNRKGGVSP